jgi:hypothetical protein
MRVQRVQQSQSFGMLKPMCGRKALSNLDRNVLLFLRGAKEELANTAVDLELVGEKADPVVSTPYCAYTGDFIPVIDEDTKYLKYLRIKAVIARSDKYNLLVAGKEHLLSIKMPSAVAAEKAYADMQKAQNKYERAVAFTKILDDNFILQNKQNALENAANQPKDSIISDILGA